MASDWYDEGLNQLLRGAASATNWSTGTIILALVKTGYTFSAVHDFFNDVVANEADATNYARASMAGMSVAEASGTVKFDATDVTFGTLGNGTNNTIVGAIVFADKGTDTVSPVLFFIDFTDTLTNGGDFTVQFHANGIATVA